MKTLILFIVLFTFSFSLTAKAPNASRQITDFNFVWQFHLGDVKGAFLPNGAKSQVASWSKVRLPHDWSASLPYSKEGAASSTGFKIDVSKFGIQGDNLVAVRVDRTAHNDARWYTGSGIYRDVRLVKTNNNHIAHWGV